MDILLKHIRACTHCAPHLPRAPRPVMNAARNSLIIITGQAPGSRVHEAGVMWSDASGERLLDWLGVESSVLHNPRAFAHLPMGFCYPGKAASGDAPPRPECAPLWHDRVLNNIDAPRLHLLIGRYAQKYYLDKNDLGSLTANVRQYRKFLPRFFPLPHPSPRNTAWFHRHPWFLNDVVPALQEQVQDILNNAGI